MSWFLGQSIEQLLQSIAPAPKPAGPLNLTSEIPAASPLYSDNIVHGGNMPTDAPVAPDYQQYIDRVMSQDSPLMVRARAIAGQQMSERGLRNSSMAIEAGQNAVIDQAHAIATPTFNRDTTRDTGTIDFNRSIDKSNIDQSNQRTNAYLAAQLDQGKTFQQSALGVMNDQTMKANEKSAYIKQLQDWSKSENERTASLFKSTPTWGLTAGLPAKTGTIAPGTTAAIDNGSGVLSGMKIKI